MSKTKHTPTPWKVAANLDKDFPFRVDGQPTEETPCGFSPCLVFGNGTSNRGVAKANATHIVSCVNAHDDLVAALKRLLSEAVPAACDCRGGGDNIVKMTDREWEAVVSASDQARAALKKCGGID